ncbi:hypothetical protein [Couchioplanes caeruleus]|uniref:Terminase small subunit n=2 Tax=Couchioplanes caeruleus TaxID=56438 RepID=A0A1K0G7U4_9ACTN|nr:hypothetical protein [Couchioplanes caeruleus]OJF13314.1 hypothetical protein BG844_16005 [Couchioplanes caeruleus subsp. caeruleus]ROP33489.1 hypothetical protein EDD30_6475 [Couchioplanes caeruleus]
MSEAAVLPWDRHKREPEAAYAYFAVYRDLGRTRTVAKVATEVNKSRDYLHKIAAAWRWVQRAQAFDREQDRMYGEALAERRREMAERHARLASALQSKVVARLQSLDASKLTPGDIARWLEVTTRLERLALGLPDSATAVSGPGGAPIEVEIGAMGEADRSAFFRALVAEASARAGGDLPSNSSDEGAGEKPSVEDEGEQH